MLRKLSSSERFMCQLGQESPIFFAMTARILGALSLPEMEEALIKTRQKHPLTAVHVVDGPDGHPWFAASDVTNVPLCVVKDGTDDLWLGVIAEELTVLVDPKVDPLVRYVWIKGDGFSDLIVVCHHAVTDGLGAAYLIRDILTFLGNTDAEVSPFSIIPPVEELIPECTSSAGLGHPQAKNKRDFRTSTLTYIPIDADSIGGALASFFV